MKRPINVDDYRSLARSRLPRTVFDFLEGGAEDEHGLRHNRAAFDTIRFQPRRLVDVSRRTTASTLFGKRCGAPLVIAPTGLNAILWPDGDLALARAAARAGIPFALSTASTSSIEDVAKASDGELWFQLYVVHRKLAQALVARAHAAGYTTLVLTTDAVINGKRERDMRNGFGLPIKHSLRTIADALAHTRWTRDWFIHGMPGFANFAGDVVHDAEVQAALMRRQMDASFDWDDLAWLRDLWPHTLLVKGILHPDDATRCARLGVDGVILSNHGGRQLDGAIAPIRVLPAVTRATNLPLLIDSGVRRGADVVKAVALGARAVLLGRAVLYGLAARGEQGVADVLEILRTEIDTTLAQIGCPSIDALSPDVIWAACPQGGTAARRVEACAATVQQLP
jgi:(S)-mandelate dehydrogenase